jgi:hypothetical protein
MVFSMIKLEKNGIGYSKDLNKGLLSSHWFLVVGSWILLISYGE